MCITKTIDLKKEYFGSFDDKRIYLYTLKAGFITLQVMNYGATITAIEMPDRRKQVNNIVAGFSSFDEYMKPHPYMGAVIGRFSNRITGGQFNLSGNNYQLSINDFPNHLHGGINGFDKKVWQPVAETIGDDHCSLSLTTFSNDGEEGYPGNLNVTVVFTLTNCNEIEIAYKASTDKATPLSLTNHSYFNLSGFVKPTIKDHELTINSTYYNEKNENNTSTGKLLMCAGTPHDFRQAKKIGSDIGQLHRDMGYDHNHVIDGFGQGVQPVAKLTDDFSGRVLEVQSDMPGVQVYTSNWWDGSLTGSQGVPYIKHGAIALETQQLPDAPNHAAFPDSILRPGDDFSSRTIYKFSLIK
ncbi:MAG: galactose mutarotase [Marinilabiliaceae bacterium]|nr:galactose mutarotase [Marinilabiliaceae bacterium]